MPRYRYTGDYPLILTGLVAGVNATVAGRTAPEGSLVAHPGDVIETAAPYEHALLAEVAPPKTPARRRSNPPTKNEE